MNQLSLAEQPSGKRLRDKGIAKVEAHNEAVLLCARIFARWKARTNGSVTVDDVRGFLELHNLEFTHPNAYGAIFRGKEWECLGWQESRIASNHARHIRVWRLTRPEGA